MFKLGRRMLATVLLGLCVLPVQLAAGVQAPTSSRDLALANRPDYSFMWWAHGWRGEKIRCVQTSSYGLAMDIQRVQAAHFGPIPEPLSYPWFRSLRRIWIFLAGGRPDFLRNSGFTEAGVPV